MCNKADELHADGGQGLDDSSCLCLTFVYGLAGAYRLCKYPVLVTSASRLTASCKEGQRGNDHIQSSTCQNVSARDVEASRIRGLIDFLDNMLPRGFEKL